MILVALAEHAADDLQLKSTADDSIDTASQTVSVSKQAITDTDVKGEVTLQDHLPVSNKEIVLEQPQKTVLEEVNKVVGKSDTELLKIQNIAESDLKEGKLVKDSIKVSQSIKETIQEKENINPNIVTKETIPEENKELLSQKRNTSNITEVSKVTNGPKLLETAEVEKLSETVQNLNNSSPTTQATLEQKIRSVEINKEDSVVPAPKKVKVENGEMDQYMSFESKRMSSSSRSMQGIVVDTVMCNRYC